MTTHRADVSSGTFSLGSAGSSGATAGAMVGGGGAGAIGAGDAEAVVVLGLASTGRGDRLGGCSTAGTDNGAWTEEGTGAGGG
jgi:hypothetical protein